MQKPGFILEARPKHNLPKEMPSNIPGTCYFLENYRHNKVDEREPLNVHIEAAVTELGINCSNM